MRGEAELLRVCLLREGMREKGLVEEPECSLEGEEEREKRDGEKHSERFFASICAREGGREGGSE